MRKLASIRCIAEIKGIPEADKICAYRVDGWYVVDSIGKHDVGDLVVYLECDSWVPTELAPFLSKGKEPKIYKGIAGERLRIQKFKKQISQGLLLPVPQDTIDGAAVVITEGLDITDHLGIIKWEPEPEFRSADAKGVFPSFIPKTDQPRIQNIIKELESDFNSYSWLIEEKIDGSSFTCYLNSNEFGVCSRNLELKDSDNTFWNTAKKYKLEEKLRNLGRNIAVQCEMIGIGIQGNRYGLSGHELRLFDVFDIDSQSYLSTNDRNDVAELLGILVVPFIKQVNCKFSLEDILKEADGKSKINGCVREGFVYRKVGDSRFTFKVISNSYLLCEK